MKVDSVLRRLSRHDFPGSVCLLGVSFVFALVGPMSLMAQSGDGAQLPSLAELRSSYEKARLDATVPFSAELEKLKDGYAAALGRLQGELQAEGNLEAVLEVRSEVEAFQKTGQSGSGEIESAELVKLRVIFSESKQSIVARQGAAMQKLVVAYQSALEALVPELTKAGRVEDAVKAKAMAAALKVEDSDDVAEMKPAVALRTEVGSGDGPGAGEIPVKVTSRAEKRLAEVPKVDAPLVDAGIFSETEWPLLVTIPQGSFKIEGKVEIKKEAGRMLAFSEGSSFRGSGDKAYWNIGNSATVGKSLTFDDFNFRGNLGSKLYFEHCSFEDMLMGKGGAWFGGSFMSRWQFRHCAISGSFTDTWNTRHTGVQMLGCKIERVTFPPLGYQKEDEPSAIALNDEMMILDSYFYKCEIPVSVLSLTEDCVFVDCRFVDDPKPLTFAEKVKRTLKVEDCDVKYKALPDNLEFELEELPRQ